MTNRGQEPNTYVGNRLLSSRTHAKRLTHFLLDIVDSNNQLSNHRTPDDTTCTREPYETLDDITYIVQHIVPIIVLNQYRLAGL